MIGLALLSGVIVGLRFRVGRVLTATAVVLALGLGAQIRDDGDAAMVLAGGALYAGITQVVAFLVHILKDTFAGSPQARA